MTSLEKSDLVTTNVQWRWPSRPSRKGASSSSSPLAIALLFWWVIDWDWLGWIAAGLTLWIAAFFRDPVRTTPIGRGADHRPRRRPGDDDRDRAAAARTVSARAGSTDEPVVRVSIFMSVFDVHINRTPIAGTITRIVYIAGKFLNADLDKASEDNERQHILVEGEDGTKVAFTQIAGLVARRIVPWVKAGDRVVAGQRVGLIRFGSRVDVYLPAGTSSPGPARPAHHRRRDDRRPDRRLRADRGRRPVSGRSAARSRGAAFRCARSCPMRSPRSRSARASPASASPSPANGTGADRRDRASPRCSTAWTAASPARCAGQTRFGAELDSLSDVIAFGVSPAIILHLWVAAAPGRGFGWMFALAYAVCMALRLARFNARIDVEDQPHKSAGFLTGVPAPAGAGLMLLPIYLWLASDGQWDWLQRLPAGRALGGASSPSW